MLLLMILMTLMMPILMPMPMRLMAAEEMRMELLPSMIVLYLVQMMPMVNLIEVYCRWVN